MTTPTFSNTLPEAFSDAADEHALSQHGPAIDATLAIVRARLLTDLAKLYRLRISGKNIPIPTEITVKDVVVRLS